MQWIASPIAGPLLPPAIKKIVIKEWVTIKIAGFAGFGGGPLRGNKETAGPATARGSSSLFIF